MQWLLPGCYPWQLLLPGLGCHCRLIPLACRCRAPQCSCLSRAGVPLSPQIGVGYKRKDGSLLASVPADLEDMEAAEVVYETLPGWKADISKVNNCLSLTKLLRYCGTVYGTLPGVKSPNPGEGQRWRRRTSQAGVEYNRCPWEICPLYVRDVSEAATVCCSNAARSNRFS